MRARLLFVAALGAALAAPVFAQRFGGGFASIQVFLGNFSSFGAWQHSHNRSARYCRLDHYQQHIRYDQRCEVCRHNREFHGHYLSRSGQYNGYWDRGRFWRWDPDNRYYGRDSRRGRYERRGNHRWDDDYYDRRRDRRRRNAWR